MNTLAHASDIDASFACIPEWVEHLGEWRKDHPLIIWAPFEGEGRTITYAAFAREVASIAGGLIAMGVEKGSRVLLHLDNCPETILMRFACARIGAMAIATNTAASADEFYGLAKSSRAKFLVTHSHYDEVVERAAAELDWTAYVGSDSCVTRLEDAIPFAQLYGAESTGVDLKPTDDASILFTTGSTGKPKGVVWSHSNVLWAAQLNAQQQAAAPSDVHLLFLPLFHVVGLAWGFLATMFAGGTVVLQPRFSSSRYWDAAIRHQATVASHVNFTVDAVVPLLESGHRFRRWITTRYDEQLVQSLGIDMVAGWGMTEVLAQVIVSTPSLPTHNGAIGRPSLAYETRIEDHNGEVVPAGSSGHLLVRGIRGRSLFSRYDGEEAATDAAFDSRGYFETGDRVHIAADGCIRFGDRIKDVIKVGGENVSALEIEIFLMSFPDVKEVAVVAQPDSIYGEAVVAFIVPSTHSEEEQLKATILQASRKSLSKFKIPKAIYFLPVLPRIGVGKPAKSVLREALTSEDVKKAIAESTSSVNLLDNKQ